MGLLLRGAMRVVRRTNSEAAALFADANPAPKALPAKKARQVRLSDDGATSTRAVIASSVFVVLLAASLLVGGRAAIGPFLHPALEARDAQAAGDVVVTMPDGKFCRHMSFDNATASMVEGAVMPCKTDITRDGDVSAAPPPGGFAWGVH
jgi:hypothetical protein